MGKLGLGRRLGVGPIGEALAFDPGEDGLGGAPLESPVKSRYRSMSLWPRAARPTKAIMGRRARRRVEGMVQQEAEAGSKGQASGAKVPCS